MFAFWVYKSLYTPFGMPLTSLLRGFYRTTHTQRKCIAQYAMVQCPSVRFKLLVETVEWIELIFGADTNVGLSYTVL